MVIVFLHRIDKVELSKKEGEISMNKKTNYSKELITPKNSTVLNMEEMQKVDGGASNWENWLREQIDKWLKR